MRKMIEILNDDQRAILQGWADAALAVLSSALFWDASGYRRIVVGVTYAVSHVRFGSRVDGALARTF